MSQIFVRVLGGGSTLIAPEFAQRIVGLIVKLQANVGVEVVRSAASTLTMKQQKIFQDCMEGKVHDG